MRFLLILFACFVSFGWLTSSPAHHSRVEFVDEVVELEGELTEIDWRNPHPSLRIAISDGPARGQIWHVQVYGAVNTLRRAGVEGDMFTVGQHVRVAGQPSSRRANTVLGTHVLLPEGFEVVLGGDFDPRWSPRYIGGKRGWRVDNSVLNRAKAENRSIFRVWSVPSRSDEDTERHYPRSEQAIAAQANWNDHDNPITRCEPTWMPFAMRQPLGFEMIDEGDVIALNLVYYGAKRRIYVREARDASQQAPSRLGLSIGRWEGNSLIVETSRIIAPSFDNRGSMQSEQMTTIETFTLSADQSRLDYEMIMNDPIGLTEPGIYRTHFVAIGEPFEPYLCEQ